MLVDVMSVRNVCTVVLYVLLIGCSTVKLAEVSDSNSAKKPGAYPPINTALNPIAGFKQSSASKSGPRSTRVFADRESHPPEDFAAFGIVAFSSRATDATSERHLTLCEAYIAALPHHSELEIPKQKQMVTVWPIESKTGAAKLNSLPRNKICSAAIKQYDLAISLTAINHAAAAGAQVDNLGPYLLAWSPALEKGSKDTLVLVKDLSNVSTSKEAISVLTRWRKQIESDPQIWETGWNLDKIKSEIRQFVDFYGPQIAELID